MKNNFNLHPSSLILLSRLWLHEPSGDDVARAVDELGLPFADPDELAQAYADLFLLNVYPYGTAFTDPDGELNAPGAQRIAAMYDAHGYRPAELAQVGAPDHLGLCLGFIAHVGERELGIGEWAPVCCLAAERDPSAHPFYRALAEVTRDCLLQSAMPAAPAFLHSSFDIPHSDEDVHLRDIVRFFLAPARCGIFLSRSRWGQMAKSLGMRLSFGSRFDVADAFFRAAGDNGQVADLLRALDAEISQWAAAYSAWAAGYPTWKPFAPLWLERTDAAQRMLETMRLTLDRPPELETDDAALAVRLS